MLTVIRSVAAGWIISVWVSEVSDELGDAVGPRRLLGLGVFLELVAELGDEALRRPRARLAEGAYRPARDLVGDALQERAVPGPSLAVDHAGRDLLHPERALAAGRALAAALVGVECVYVAERLDHADRVVHDDHAARPAHGADHRERVEVHRDVLDAPVVLDHLGAGLALALVALPEPEHLGGGPPGDHRLERAPGKRAAAHLVQELAHRHLADLEFVVAGAPHVARDAEDARPGVPRGADLGVRLSAHVGDVLHVAERLDVVHDRRALVEAEDRREIRRLDARIGPLALERLDEAGLLAADVGARAAVDVDLAAVAGPQDVRAGEAGRPGLGDRL